MSSSMDFAYIRVPKANMHVLPSAESALDSQAIYGTSIKIVDKQTGWLKIQTPDGYQGWTEGENVCYRSTSYPSKCNQAKVKTLFAHVYAVNDLTCRLPLMTLPFESFLEISSDQGDLTQRWIEVRLVTGELGWVQHGDLELKPRALSLKEMLELSQQFLGLPYTWGGLSTYGFDCSGFVQMLYRQMEIFLPRNSDQQAKMKRGKKVEIGRELPGDLLFFGPEKGRVTHVGLHLRDGNFIHAKALLFQGSPIVQNSHLGNPQWPEKYLLARRLI